ncbi:MAG: hypothetical protein Q4P78_02465 [Rothia sp. (in: high G+C Gram-positive bacteria)]|uniref:hypothetical protein n=1 Tax=Rothia sp. (in: high G+C Gram-positive bacteria) TaxID=1885016 RepID=UPI0026DF17C4|nr:hypothetical protein [Rothia sp. (in: high G+C Gram-positive bacteria)]MDO5750051.1 hypothetical protein [Rothia sp. (in: high G+C Gram-positive bacteria)]
MSQNPAPLDPQSWANQFYAAHNRQPSAEEYQAALAAGQVVIPQSAVPAGVAPAPQPAPQTPEQKKNAKVLLWSSAATVGLILLVVIALAVIGMFSQPKSAAGKYKADYAQMEKAFGDGSAPPSSINTDDVYITLELKEDKSCEVEMSLGSAQKTKVSDGCSWEQNGNNITLKGWDSSSKEGHATLSNDGKTLTLDGTKTEKTNGVSSTSEKKLEMKRMNS